jgi:hypothetical protein
LTDGQIKLNGTRFGAAQGTGWVQILGCSATTCTNPTDSAVIDSWSNTLVQIQVPTAIADTVNTGKLVIKQGTGGNGKVHDYTDTGFRVLPRITSFVPASAFPDSAVSLQGNHFCQSGTCSSGSFGTDADLTNAPAFTSNDRIIFTSSQVADYWGGWDHTSSTTRIPASAALGTNAVYLISGGYDSNTANINVQSAVPSNPTVLYQYRNAALTNYILTGGQTGSAPIYLTSDMAALGNSGGTLYTQVEVQPTGTAFACGVGVCGTAIESAGKADPGPWDCSVAANGCAVAVTPAGDNTYHWQARIRHNKSGTDYYSNWVSYPATSTNAETATDFQLDGTGPTITAGPLAVPDTNSAVITWSTANELSTTQVQFNLTGTYNNDCSVNNDCTTLDVNLVNNHNVALSNLDSGTTYHYRVRSKDGAGNETIGGDNTFQTTSVTQPMKTTGFFIVGANGAISAATTSYFSVWAPETSVAVKNVFVEVTGLVSGGSNPITIQVNDASSVNYDVNAASPTQFRFIYKISTPAGFAETRLNLNDAEPCTNGINNTRCNQLNITPGSGMSIDVVSAKVIFNYAYTP